jgi:hypothetical protein
MSVFCLKKEIKNWMIICTGLRTVQKNEKVLVHSLMIQQQILFNSLLQFKDEETTAQEIQEGYSISSDQGIYVLEC